MQHDVTAQLEDAAIAAGLAHVVSWEQVRRILGALPVPDGCPYCGGYLEPWHPDSQCFRCAGCGRLHTQGVEGVWLLDYDEFNDWAARYRPSGTSRAARDAGSIPAPSTTSNRAKEAPF